MGELGSSIVLLKMGDEVDTPESPQEAVPLPDEWDSIFAEATSELEAENYDDAGEKWYTLADYAHEAGDKANEALCRGHVATCFIMLGTEYAREAQTHYHHALALAEEADYSPLQVELLNKMAGFYSRLGEVHRTVACLKRLLELHDVTGDTEAELHVMGSLAGISYDTEDYEMAVKHYMDVLERAKTLGDNELIGKVYCNLGIAHQELEQFDKAIEFYSQSLELAKELGNKEMEGLAYSNLADASSTQEEYDEACDYLDQTIATYVDLGDKAAEGKARAELSIAKHHSDEQDEAISSMLPRKTTVVPRHCSTRASRSGVAFACLCASSCWRSGARSSRCPTTLGPSASCNNTPRHTPCCRRPSSPRTNQCSHSKPPRKAVPRHCMT